MKHLFFVFVLSIALFADSVPTRCEEIDSDSGGRSFMALPVMLYTTDTGFGGGMAAFKTYNPTRVRVSSIQTFFVYTAKKQVTSAVRWDHYFADNRNRIMLGGNYIKFPSDFYGLGNDTVNDDPGSYTPEYFQGEFMFEHRVRKNWRLKTRLLFKNQSLIKENPDDVLKLSGASWAEGRLDIRAGFAVLWDSRDNVFATKTGTFAQLESNVSLYQDKGGAYNTLSIDVRHFYNPVHELVFASMFMIDDSRGDIPFYELPELGGEERLRGYERERFRDRNLICFQQDMRFPIWGPVGGAVFGATGRVSDSAGDLFAGTYHSAFGGGLRFFFNKEENLVVRADYARGADSSGVYFTFAEAF